MKNLKAFNRVRAIAQNINNKGFKREYQNIITPILDKYKNKIASDDEMLSEIKVAIKNINHLSKTYQYKPNKSKNYSFEDHNKLFEVELLTKKLLQGGF